MEVGVIESEKGVRYLRMGVIFFRGSDKTQLTIFHQPEVTQIDKKVDFSSSQLSLWLDSKGPFLLSSKGIIILIPHKFNTLLIAFPSQERIQINFIKFTIICASFWNGYHNDFSFHYYCSSYACPLFFLMLSHTLNASIQSHPYAQFQKQIHHTCIHTQRQKKTLKLYTIFKLMHIKECILV